MSPSTPSVARFYNEHLYARQSCSISQALSNMLLSLFFASVALLFIWGCYNIIAKIVSPPAHFPKNIPTIPFYYTLIPLFKEVDQEELYHKYLEKPLTECGAVKMFFGGHWNVVITRPAYMAQVLKHDEDFPKTGNHVKNPHSVLALYTGENIISAVGETWKHFATLAKPALQADIDASIVVKNTHKLISILLQEHNKTNRVAVLEHIQAHAIANVTESLLGSSFEAFGNQNHPLLKLQREIKPKIFHPFHLNFPNLDRFPIPSREEAKRLVKRFQNELASLVMQGHRHKCQPDSNNLGCRLLSAYGNGQLSEYHMQQNALITFVAGHENPMILTLSNLFVLADKLDLQEQVRQEVMSLPPEDRINPDALARLPLLTSIIFETLRMFPPLSQIMNKRTASDVMLGEDILLRAGTYTGYNGYSTNRNRDFWGRDADVFRPSRWGETIDDMNSLFRRATSKAAFITFHGGKRACLGQRWALAAHRVTMSLFLTSVKWHLDPTWPRKMTPVSILPSYGNGTS
ncbi:Dit2 protein [Xylaria telfairii]|nr:Dit2 protein [Xylaria telfairii]